MSSAVKPTPIALVVCDNIYSEPGGKTALVGLFGGITAAKFPARHPRMAVFASLTGLRGDATAKLEIIHAETDEAVAVAQGPFPGGYTPLTVVDINFILNNVVFPREGTYYIRFWANEHLILMRPFEVRPTRKRGASKDAQDRE
jgi:hypothetical protein